MLWPFRMPKCISEGVDEGVAALAMMPRTGAVRRLPGMLDDRWANALLAW